MKKAMKNAPPRSRGPRRGGVEVASRREQRQKELQQLEEAHKNGDTEKLGELISEIKQRMENMPTRSSGRG